MATLHEQLKQNVKRDATIVAFNRGEFRVEDQHQPIEPTEQQVIELADMTDEQKRIVAAGQMIAGSFPQADLSKDDLIAWMKAKLFRK